jgi:hypothetical protein
MPILVDLVYLSNSLHLCLSQISCLALDSALPEDEQKFNLGDALAIVKCQFHVPTC